MEFELLTPVHAGVWPFELGFRLHHFGLLIWVKAPPPEFRTAWFTESVLSASLIVLVFRSRRWLGQSRPSAPLLATTLLTCLAVLILPLLPIAHSIGFVPLPFGLLGLILAIVTAYVTAAELAKHRFFSASPKVVVTPNSSKAGFLSRRKG